MNYAKNRDASTKSLKTYYTDNKKTKCANERNKYVLADPKLDVKELYMKEIQFNGNPTKGNVVWRSLIKTAVQKLTEINLLYKNVDEVINSTSSTMLEKATKEDIVGFQAYTIRNLDNKLSTESDIDQYKV